MNDRMTGLRTRTRDGHFRRYRQPASPDLVRECERESLSWPRRMSRLTRSMCEAERVVIEPDERIVFTRTLPAPGPVNTPAAWAERVAGRTLHEGGLLNNVCADWGLVLAQGLLGRRAVAAATRARAVAGGDDDAIEFLDAAIEAIDAVLALAARYAAEARRLGLDEVAANLEAVPAHPPRTFQQALQALRLLHSVVWLSGHHHVGLGRLDQYLWPYLEADLRAGRLGEAAAHDLLAEFFIALNRDSDLYPGIQQGDNGQTVTLGGVTRDGRDAVNPLTWLALRVARDVGLIDPKINLRITATTELALLELATELTRKGLGFPQYANDDVVIPALAAHGYELEDARDYTVAACWEFIVPGRGMDVVNIGAVSFPHAADTAIRAGLTAGDTFEEIVARTKDGVARQVHERAEPYDRLLWAPAPYYSMLMADALETGRDHGQGARYRNLGIHGAAAASAADALAAVRRHVFELGDVAPDDLLHALDADFDGFEDLRRRLADDSPRVGLNESAADELLARLYDWFADACEAERPASGAIVRPGTGSAMYYLWLARGRADEPLPEPVVGATADGRRGGDLFGANLAPTPGTRLRGPISVLQSYAGIDYRRVCNGGPITMELSDTVFRDEESIRKVALLVRTFARLGCQQLQLNALSADTLLDAKAHPEGHRDLIVRVWGWSGYFCELAPEYQDHVIARHLYADV
ncbi:MAG TPA: pyruvate formate lyase family protein [Candidatus Limnocylindrales bacterium]